MQETIGADTVQALRRDVLQEPTNELVRLEGHRSQCSILAIAVAEGHGVVVESDDPLVTEGRAMDVATEVAEEALRVLWHRTLGVHDPRFIPDALWKIDVGRAFLASAMKRLRKPTASALTGTKKSLRPPRLTVRQVSPSGSKPPPGTIMWTCGCHMSVRDQVWITARAPICAPRNLGSWHRASRASNAARHRAASRIR